MTIKAVFRVQCDGPCKGWLSLPDDHQMGTHAQLVARPTAERAGLWPGERTARRAALGNGWDVRITSPMTLLCPACQGPPKQYPFPAPAPCLGTHDTWAVCKECA